MVELVIQMEAMQSELRELRNQVELQTHEIERLQARQRDLTQDLDRRVRDLERGRGAVVRPRPSSPDVRPPSAIAPPAARPAPVVRPASPQEQSAYDAAFNLMKQGFYERAAKAFRSFISTYPDSSLTANAQYWVAEANYVVRNFRLALEEFAKVVNEYSDSSKVPDALLKIGYSHYELGSIDEARRALTEVIKRFPNTTVAKSAQIRLAKMKKEGH